MDDESKQLLREIRDLLAGQARHREIDFETLQKIYTEQDHITKQLMPGATWRFYVASFVVFFVIGTATVVCAAMQLKVLS